MPKDSPATDAGTEERRDRDIPDHWAPVNRREMRDDVDRFRNVRMQIPRTLDEARQLVELALEYFEHAHEVTTRTQNTLADLDAELATFTNNTTDEYRTVKEHRDRIAAKGREAGKEFDVASRRHATAIAYLYTFKGE